jgi:hypothetical protein
MLIYPVSYDHPWLNYTAGATKPNPRGAPLYGAMQYLSMPELFQSAVTT